jgi:cell pole-organizing protein PopZ
MPGQVKALDSLEAGAMHQAGEPSVEEILASIKKVIARDNRDAAAAPRQAPEPARQAAAEEAEDEVLDLGAIGECVDDDVDTGVPPLVGSETASSIGESLAALAMMAQPPAAPQIVRSGETSLEGLVRELLRPALADWLDKNLPPMVEKLVAVEIARIVGKKG